MSRHALALAGGAGSRLRAGGVSVPKPLATIRGATLLERALRRGRAVADEGCVWVSCAQEHEGGIGEAAGVARDRLIVEPVRRDTALACALGAALIERADPGAVIATLPTDHVIDPELAAAQALMLGLDIAASDERALVVFGVEPTEPADRFGYVVAGGEGDGARPVECFVEKPSVDEARLLIDRGALWNSGMFAWRAAALLEAARVLAPGVYGAAVAAAEAWGDAERARAAMEAAPVASVDRAVLERAARDERFRVVAVPLRARWADVGDVPALEAARRAGGGR